MQRTERRALPAEVTARTVDPLVTSGTLIAEVRQEFDLARLAVRRRVEKAQIAQSHKDGVTQDQRDDLNCLRRANKALRTERRACRNHA